MYRKGKFGSNKSFKRPHFACSIREKTNKYLKRATNRAARRQPIDSLASGCAYKRLIEVWDYNDMNALHYYCRFHPEDVDPTTRLRSIKDFYPEDEEKFHVLRKGGNRYFQK